MPYKDALAGQHMNYISPRISFSGETIHLTVAEDFIIGNLAYLDSESGEATKAANNSLAKTYVVGLCVKAADMGEDGIFLVRGMATFGDWTPGLPLYLGATGSLTQIKPAYPAYIVGCGYGNPDGDGVMFDAAMPSSLGHEATDAVAAHEATYDHSEIHAPGSDAEDADSIAAILTGVSADVVVDADTFNFIKSVGGALKKITWVNIKSTLKSYFDGLYSALGHSHALSALTEDSGHRTVTDTEKNTWNNKMSGTPESIELIPSGGTAGAVGNFRLRVAAGTLYIEKCEGTPNNWVNKQDIT